MYIFSIIIRIYSSFTLYTLFANVILTDEVNAHKRNWSKERITKDVAIKLAEIVANAKPRNTEDFVNVPEDDRLFYTRKLNKEEYYYSDESEGDSSYDNVSSDYDNKTGRKIEFRARTEKKQINIDDIVEKVRSKIEDDFRVKYGLDKIANKEQLVQQDISYNNEVRKLPPIFRPENENKAPEPKVVYENVHQAMNYGPKDQFIQPEKQKTLQVYQPDINLNPFFNNETTEKWFELVPQFEPGQNLNNEPPNSVVVQENTESNAQFKTIKLAKHDSYEDYATPAKEKNFYSSAEKIPKKRPALITKKSYHERHNRQQTIQPKLHYREETAATPETTTSIYYDQDTPKITEEVHGRTENLGGDYVVRDFPKRIGASVRPTRHYYKISSPNYYGMLSTYAEKYNFNEPLPERDRQKENFRPIGNPPASINGKVRLVKNKHGYFE